MNTSKNIPSNSFQPKERSLLLKIFKFIVVLLLEIFASKLKPHRPTLQGRVMGQKLPFSDKYYIPDDPNHR